jgi:hypothetical protein
MSANPEATMRLVSALRALEDLAEWPTLGGRLEAAREAMLGTGGFTEREVLELEEYATIWTNLRPDLQAFYRLLAPKDDTAGAALWRILYGGPPLAGWQDGKLRRLWEEATGLPPAIDLCPRRRRGEW